MPYLPMDLEHFIHHKLNNEQRGPLLEIVRRDYANEPLHVIIDKLIEAGIPVGEYQHIYKPKCIIYRKHILAWIHRTAKIIFGIKKLKRVNIRCSCGVRLTGQDAAFWGECKKCRDPKNTRSKVVGRVTGQERADIEYHGGRFHSAEW